LAHAHYKTGLNCTALAKLYYHQGQLYHFSGQYLQAIPALHQALTYTEQCGCIRRQAYILAATGKLYLDLRALNAAASAFQQAQKLAAQIDDQALLWSLELAQAAVARWQGDLTRAARFHEPASRMAHRRQIPAELGACAAEAGRLAIARNHPDKARSHFEQALHYFTMAGQDIDRAKIYLTLAQLHHKAKNMEMAAACLSQTFELTASLESMHPLVMTALTVLPVLDWASKNYHSDPAVANLLASVDDFTENMGMVRGSVRAQPLVVPFTPPQLTIQTLGYPRVLRDGKPITHPEWQCQKKVREIFFYLAAHPDGRSHDNLSDEFWADSVSEHISRGIIQTKYKLNAALGKDVILHDRELDTYRINKAIDYVYDVQQFEDILRCAEKATQESELKSCLHDAIKLYRGSYLPDVEGSWVLQERHRLNQLYLNANMQLAHLYFAAADYETADGLCRSCLKEDPAFEPAHRMIMEINGKQGNRGGIIRQYKLCHKALLKLAAVPVSLQTRQLYRSLLT
jgi:DNA-binding SARP family transcriptional activator